MKWNNTTNIITNKQGDIMDTLTQENKKIALQI